MNRPRAWLRVEIPQENLQIAVNSQQSPDGKTPTSEGEVGVLRPVIQNHATVALGCVALYKQT